MKLVFINPWVHRIGGNKIELSLAAELASMGHSVTVLAHTVNREAVGEVSRMIGRAGFAYLRETTQVYRGHSSESVWQMSPWPARILAAEIRNSHRREKLDIVLLWGNEGRSLARSLKRHLPVNRPLLGWSLMELIDHSALLRYERDWSMLRALVSPAYPVAHWIWAEAMRSFDFLCANSPWTADLLSYLYGTPAGAIVIAIPPSDFELISGGMGSPYLAVPTVSLGPREAKTLQLISRAGLPLVAFGPRKVNGIAGLGVVPERRVRELMSGAAATLFLFDYEALGLIPIESLAVGTPVVTLPKQGPGRMWAGHPFVTLAEDAGDLIDACNRLLSKPIDLQRRAEVQSTVSKYGAPEAASRFASYLEGLLATRERRRSGD